MWLEIAPPSGPGIVPGTRAYAKGGARCFVSREPGGWHLSISRPDRYPGWDEIKDARYRFVPNEVTMAMILPPKEDYVNFHPYCFHLHEIEGDHHGALQTDG